MWSFENAFKLFDPPFAFLNWLFCVGMKNNETNNFKSISLILFVGKNCHIHHMQTKQDSLNIICLVHNLNNFSHVGIIAALIKLLRINEVSGNANYGHRFCSSSLHIQITELKSQSFSWLIFKWGKTNDVCTKFSSAFHSRKPFDNQSY